MGSFCCGLWLVKEPSGPGHVGSFLGLLKLTHIIFHCIILPCYCCPLLLITYVAQCSYGISQKGFFSPSNHQKNWNNSLCIPKIKMFLFTIVKFHLRHYLVWCTVSKEQKIYVNLKVIVNLVHYFLFFNSLCMKMESTNTNSMILLLFDSLLVELCRLENVWFFDYKCICIQ